MSEIGDPITVEIEAMFAKQPHFGVWVRAVKPTPAVPRPSTEAVFSSYWDGGEVGPCPACGAEWETIDCGPHNSFNEQVHAVGCDYLAYLDWHDALLEREGDGE